MEIEEKPSDWKRLKTNNNVEFLAKGSDSSVYKVQDYKSNTIAKEYDKLQEKFGKAETKNILHNYYIDTERAKELLQENPNPLNQSIKIDGIEYTFHYTVVPQGEIVLEKYSQEYPGLDKVPLVIGQSFQHGLNYDDLNNSQIDKKKLEQMTDEQKLFYYSKSHLEDINKNCRELFDFLNKKLERDFSFAASNIKPYLNTKERRVEITITDLASSLQQYHIGFAIRKYEKGE